MNSCESCVNLRCYFFGCSKKAIVNEDEEVTAMKIAPLIQKQFSEFLKDEDGLSGIEYGLIVGLIFVVILLAVNAMADKTTLMWMDIVNHM